MAEADFSLRGMHVYIDLCCRHFQEQQDDRIDAGRNDISIGFGERVLDQAVADEASVDEDENRIAV